MAMKQDPIKWNKPITDFKSKGLERLKSEMGVFKTKENNLFVDLYVDDGIKICNKILNHEHFLEDLKFEFKIEIYTNTKKFVGIEVHRCKRMQCNYKSENVFWTYVNL